MTRHMRRRSVCLMLAPYTVFLLDPIGPARSRRFNLALRERVRELGLKPGDLEIRDASGFDSSEPPSAVAAVYFGGVERTRETTEVAARFVSQGLPVIPVVPTLVGYSGQVPSALAGVNGLADDGGDEAKERVVNAVLVGLGLMRERRRVFISYRRRESRGVARQLAFALTEAGFRIFLDTWSVERGCLVQPALMEAMSDTDIVVFLDTPGVLGSPWVAKEFARAHGLSITILQVIWPGWKRATGSDMAFANYLDVSDFQASNPSTRASGRLRIAAVRSLVDQVERLRAHAWKARRARLVEGFIRQVRATVGRVEVEPDGALRLLRRNGSNAAVVPVIGAPESTELERAAISHLGQAAEVRVLYDRLGLGAERRRHLAWLDQHLPVRTLGLDEVEAWL